MDEKGQANIEFLFCIIISIMILISIIPYLNQNIDSNINTINNLEGRILLNQLANDINQVNSNMYGFSKYIQLPDKIENNSYLITIKTTEIILEYKNKKGKTNINPINIINSNNESLIEIKLYNGAKYKISKELVNNSQKNIINQSSILINQIIE
ncbi:MAG: hypothetical protein MJ203_00280 [archaeon]|nr:hypothetical protein [archaeon]